MTNPQQNKVTINVNFDQNQKLVSIDESKSTNADNGLWNNLKAIFQELPILKSFKTQIVLEGNLEKITQALQSQNPNVKNPAVNEIATILQTGKEATELGVSSILKNLSPNDTQGTQYIDSMLELSVEYGNYGEEGAIKLLKIREPQIERKNGVEIKINEFNSNYSGVLKNYQKIIGYNESGKVLIEDSQKKMSLVLDKNKIIYNSGTQTQLKSSDEIAKQLAVDVLTSGINQSAAPKKIEINQVKNVGSNNITQTDSFDITNKSLIQSSLSSIFKTTLETNFNFNSFGSNNNYLDNSRSFNFNSQDFILTNPMDKISFSGSNSSFGGFGGFNFNTDSGKINSLSSNNSSTAYKAWDEFKFDDYKLDVKTNLKLDFSINKNIYNSLNNFGNATNHASPLAFDLDGDGIETTHAYETNIYFDIDNDNFAERVGWIAKDDGQLALDKNLNGAIDNVTELFGDYRMSAWDELRLLDSNKDNLINNQDSQFNDLRIWQDQNQNGISEEGELKSLTSHNIKEINLDYQNLNQYQKENYISSKSSITYTDGSKASNIYDVHFLNDNLNTWFKGSQNEQFGNEFEVRLEALLMPLSRGYGSLASLHVALTADDVLFNKVKEFSNLDVKNAQDMAKIPDLMSEILYRWAGVDGVDPDSMANVEGSNVDARQLRFIEKFTGLEWQQLGFRNIVGYFASLDVKKAWDGIFSELSARFLIQGAFKDIFAEAKYDFAQDVMVLNTNLNTILSRISSAEGANLDFVMNLANILYRSSGELGVNLAQIDSALSGLHGAPLYLSDKLIALDGGTHKYYDDFEKGSIVVGDDSEVLKRVLVEGNSKIFGTNAPDYIFGGKNSDEIHGGKGDDYIVGGEGDDILYGDDGKDWLIGEAGNDKIYGGNDRDKIHAGAGNDEIYGQEGNDMIQGGLGADKIDGGEGVDMASYSDSEVGVSVSLSGNERKGDHALGDVFVSVENLHGTNFSDNLTGDAGNNILHGESGNDTLRGGAGNDILFNTAGYGLSYGEAGDDELHGYDGRDILDGGEGVDTARYDRPDIKTRLNVNLETGIGEFKDYGTKTIKYFAILPAVNYDDFVRGRKTFEQTHIIIADYLALDPETEFNKRFIQGGEQFYINNDRTRSETSKIQDKLISIENVLGGDYDDEITGSLVANKLFGKKGNDSIKGNAGNDEISGGEGNDLLDGGLGDDIIVGDEGDDNLNGGADNDAIYGGVGNDILNGGAGADILNGGEGVDSINYKNSTQAVEIDLSTSSAKGGDAQGDQIYNIENITGSAFNDVFKSSNYFASTIKGGAGNDIFYSAQANDKFSGNDGDDQYVIGRGAGYDIISSEGNNTFIDSNGYTTSSSFNRAQDHIKFVDGIVKSDVSFSKAQNSLFIHIAGQKEFIKIEGYFEKGEGFKLGKLIFSDGEEMSLLETLQLTERGVEFVGSNQDDEFHASDFADIIDARGGIDVAYGYLGNDVYRYSEGSLNIADFGTIITDDSNFFDIKREYVDGGFDTIEMAEEIALKDIKFSRLNDENGSHLQMKIEGRGYINIIKFFDDSKLKLEQIKFANNQTLNLLNENLLQNLHLKNSAPEISLNEIDALEDNILEIDILSNALDVDGDALEIKAVSGASNGVVRIVGGKIQYNPNANFSGEDSFSYTVSDGQNSVSKIIKIMVDSINDAPVVADVRSVIVENNVAIIDVLASASDIDGDVLSISAITNPSNGSAQIVDGKISYTPNADFSGQDSFNYSISDGKGGLVSKTATIVISAQNDAPIANLTLVSTNEDSTVLVDVLASASDADGDVLTISEITNPSNGSAQIIDGKISYTPNANFSGNDSLSYSISDLKGGVTTQLLNIAVNAVNDVAIANNDSFVAVEDRSINILFSQILANDSDIEDGLNLQNLSAENIIFSNPANGVIVKNSNSISYTPNANYHGSDAISYQIKDSGGALSNAAIINLNIASVNDAPTIKSIISNSSVNEDAIKVILTSAAISAAFSDVDGDVLTYAASLANGNSMPSWLSINSKTGELISTNPSNSDVGNYEITITATDSSGAIAAQNFALQVENVNDAPVVFAINSSALEDAAKITAAFNGSDIDLGDVVSYKILSNPQIGEVVNNNDGTFSYSLGNNFNSLKAGQTSDVSFTYAATDKDGAQSNIATATITITGTNDAPTASLTSVATNEDNNLIIDVLASASDADGDVLSIFEITSPSNGRAQIIDGKISYTPNANFNGSDSLKYTIADNNGAKITKTLNISVASVNDAPVIIGKVESQKAQAGKEFSYQLPNNLFADVDGDSLSISATLADGSQLPSWLSFSNNKFSGVAQSANQNLTVKLTASDNSGASIAQNFDIKIENQTSAIIANDDSFNLLEDRSLSIGFSSILKNDANIQNISQLTKDNIIFDAPKNGSITFSSSSLVYRPARNYNGFETIGYQIKDAQGNLSNKAFITFNINAVNDAPKVVKSIDSQTFYSTKEVKISAKNIFSDIEGDSITYQATLQNGSPLPSWLKFNSETQEFYGTAPQDSAKLSIKLTAKDSIGASNYSSFNLTIDNKIFIGSDGDDIINASSSQKMIDGGKGNDKITGYYYDDQLFGGEGDDIIESNHGRDILTGDEGSDIFVIGNSGSSTTITDFDVKNPNEKIDLNEFNVKNYYKIKKISDLQMTQAGEDVLIKLPSGTLTVKNVKVAELTKDKFILDNAPIATNDYVSSIKEDTQLKLNISRILRNDYLIDDVTSLTKENIIFKQPKNGLVEMVGSEIIYTPNKDFNGTETIFYQIKDSEGSLSNLAKFDVSVAAVDDAPTLNCEIADQKIIAGNNLFLRLPDDSFSDVDGDNLSYQATLEDGSKLPSWLIFDSFMKGFYGKIPNQAGILNIKITAKDPDGLQTSDVFKLEITPSVNNQNLNIQGANRDDILKGGSGDDILSDAFTGNDYIYGYGGNDNIVSASGNDYIDGGEGYDIITDSSGNDKIYGGAGDDIIKDTSGNDIIYGDAGDDIITDFSGNDKIYGGEGDDKINDYSGNNEIYGDAGNDYIISSGSGNDKIYGGEGDDKINDYYGNNEIYGDAGSDYISTGSGNDKIYGGAGADNLRGGAGFDSFIFTNLSDSTLNASDVIMDFYQRDKDKIDVSALDFNSISKLGEGGDLQYYFEGNQTIIKDEDSNFAFKLNNKVNLVAEDFIF